MGHGLLVSCVKWPLEVDRVPINASEYVSFKLSVGKL